MDHSTPRLTQQAIDELKAIYRKEYGQDLSDDDAWEMGNRLVRVFAVLLRKSVDAPGTREVRTASRLTDREPNP